MTPKILFVDDDENILAGFQRNLRRRFSFDIALGGEAALQQIQSGGPYAVLVVDMQMPGMDGVEFMERAALLAPHAVRMMLTGNADQDTAVEAINRGQIFRFLSKPCSTDQLATALELALERYTLLETERSLLEGTLTGCVKILSEVLGTVVPSALGHGQRLREAMRRFARAIHAQPLWELEIAALLCSIGYTLIPPQLQEKVRKSVRLSAEEERIIRRLPKVGHDLLVGIPRLASVATIVLYQNKSFDGRGYPDDVLAGEFLPLGARMLRILNDRFKLETEGMGQAAAKRSMQEQAGRAYDPVLLEACFASIGAVLDGPGLDDGRSLAVAVSALVPGMTLRTKLETTGGVLLLGEGNVLTHSMIERLRNYEELGVIKHPIVIRSEALPQAAAGALAGS